VIVTGVSGAAGRMGRLAAESIAAADDLTLGGLYAPGHDGESIAGAAASGDPVVLAGCGVVVELTRPDVVMENLARWRRLGAHVVAGTSGFDDARLVELRRLWGEGPPNCLVVPNFSVGAVLMMRFAELAAPHFAAAEVIELHHDRKADAPSGTAAATAARIGAAAPGQRRRVEVSLPARGEAVAGVPVHAVRLPGLLAHQEVLLGNDGELLTIRHDTTDRSAFMPGLLLSVRWVAELPGVTVGLDALL
jgi:4-hydroxy-tetrahydrodipicolinate reductase